MAETRKYKIPFSFDNFTGWCQGDRLNKCLFKNDLNNPRLTNGTSAICNVTNRTSNVIGYRVNINVGVHTIHSTKVLTQVLVRSISSY